MNEPPQNVTQWCDGLRLNRFHLSLLILSALTVIFDGYDNEITAYIMPLVRKEWHMSPIQLGSITSYTGAGYLIGAVGFGMIADRIGRKKAIILAVSLFSTFSGACYFAPTVSVLCVLRFLAGLGMGGAQPVTIALVAEYAPAKIRGKAITLAGSATLGWVLAGLVSMAVIPVFGWRMVLLMGFLPIFLLPFFVAYLPESIRFLASKGRHEDAVKVIRRVEKAAGTVPVNWTEESLATPKAKAGPVKDLFSQKLIAMTILVWLTYLVAMTTTGVINQWTPTLLVNAGLSLVHSFSYKIVQSLGAAAGAFTVGACMDKFGRKGGLMTAFVVGGISIWLFGTIRSYLVLYIVGAAVGFFQLGMTPCLGVVAGEIYPTRIRSTALACAIAFGRLGAVIAGFLGGFLLLLGLTTRQFFMVFSIFPLVAASLVLMYRVNVKGHSLETITARLTAK